MPVIHTRVRNDEIQAGGNRFARALDRAGVGRRGNVAALLPNVVEYLWAYRGCAWSGRRFTPMSWRWSLDEGRVGYGVTIALVLTAIIMLITIGVNRFTERGAV